LARSSRAPISFAAARASARQVAAVEDRVADQVRVAEIRPSPRNPRHRADGIAELADSLREHGLLQPIVVRPMDAGYELIAGHCRLEAAKLLGWTEIAAVVRDETDDQAYILTLAPAYAAPTAVQAVLSTGQARRSGDCDEMPRPQVATPLRRRPPGAHHAPGGMAGRSAPAATGLRGRRLPSPVVVIISFRTRRPGEVASPGTTTPARSRS
jgi:hypothetical protein